MVHKNKSEYVFDENNKYCNEVLISIDYDLSEIYVAAMKNKDHYQSYYKKIESIFNKCNNGILRVEMRQIKNAEISWNIGYSDRQTIKNIFEIYDLNDKKAEEDKWNLIWVLLGDYFKGSNELNKIIKENLKSGLLEIEEFRRLNEKHEILDGMLENEGLKLKEWTNREYSAQLMKLLFRGDEFIKDNKRLNYFSRGTDLFSFYSITIGIIGQISINKLKRPIIMFDEPENNLHHKYIDKFVDLLNSRSNKLSFIISTHSSRLMKNAIRTDLIYNTVHVYKDPRGYSFYKKINLNRNTDRRHMYHLSDEDANAYFSRYMVLVEGETELEVFNNLAIRKIFNKTYDIDFYSVVAEKPREDLISPNNTQAETLFYSLLDIDKIIIYRNNNIELNHKDLFRSLHRDTEKYLINRCNSEIKLRDDTYFRFKKINNMIKERNEKANSLVEVNSELQHKSSEFKNLIFKGNTGVLVYDQRIKDELKKYLNSYKIFFLETTIEGAIINKKTIRYIDEYVLYKILQEAYFSMGSFNKIQYKHIITSKINCYKDNYTKILDKYNDEIKVEIIRMLFGGKTSSLMKYNNFTDCMDNYIENHGSNPDAITDEYILLKNETLKAKNIIGFNKKTSWTSDFFSYYYLRNIYDHRNFNKEYEIIYLFKSIDTILSYCNDTIGLTEQRQAQLVNSLDKYFGNFAQNSSKANRAILFSSNNNNKKMIDKMKRDFPEINDLIELFI